MRSPRISRPPLRTIGKWLLAVLAGVAGMFLVFLFTSDDPLSAVQGLLFGGFSSPGRMSQWILYSSFLMLTGASVCLVFRVGMFSLGAEGQVFIGALAGGFVVLSLGSSPATLLLGILASIAGGPGAPPSAGSAPVPSTCTPVTATHWSRSGRSAPSTRTWYATASAAQHPMESRVTYQPSPPRS